MSAHVQLTVKGRKRLPVGIPVVHQQVWVPGTVLLETTSVVLNAINRELWLIKESVAYLFQVHGTSVAGDLASGLDDSRRLCATSESSEQGGESGNVAKIQRAFSFPG
jgi:hypothetical protein